MSLFTRIRRFLFPRRISMRQFLAENPWPRPRRATAIPPCRTCGNPGAERYVEDVPDGVDVLPSGTWARYRPGITYALCEQHRHPRRPRKQTDPKQTIAALSALAEAKLPETLEV